MGLKEGGFEGGGLNEGVGLKEGGSEGGVGLKEGWV